MQNELETQYALLTHKCITKHMMNTTRENQKYAELTKTCKKSLAQTDCTKTCHLRSTTKHLNQ